ncbi:hypothetical protein [[Scytonema hofmanni] UTEX B 1581]|nr:hypothetical protein [[Scytonema hofmanni] UTEX B 1581]
MNAPSTQINLYLIQTRSAIITFFSRRFWADDRDRFHYHVRDNLILSF